MALVVKNLPANAGYTETRVWYLGVISGAEKSRTWLKQLSTHIFCILLDDANCLSNRLYIRDCQFPNIISETPTGVRKNGLLICSCQFLLSWIIFSYLISQLQYFQEIASWYCFQFKVCSATSNWKWTMSLVKNKVGIFLFFIWFPCFVLTKKSAGGLSTRSNRLEQLSGRDPGTFCLPVPSP